MLVSFFFIPLIADGFEAESSGNANTLVLWNAQSAVLKAAMFCSSTALVVLNQRLRFFEATGLLVLIQVSICLFAI